MTLFAEIPYGPDHASRLRALLGDDFARRVIATCIYEQPARTGYALADGRYAIVTTTTYGLSSKVTIFPDRAAYDAAWNGLLDDVRDPETGRPYVRR